VAPLARVLRYTISADAKRWRARLDHLATPASNVLYGDIVKGLSLPNACIERAYACHVLNMLIPKEVEKALAETFRLLQSGGVFRCVVPNVASVIERYQSSGDPLRCFQLVNALPRYGNKPTAHFDARGLRFCLENAGFHVRSAQFGDADDRLFSLVEEPGPWDPSWTIGFHCHKP